MYTAHSTSYTLLFKRPSGTSRGVLRKKKSYFILLSKANNPELVGIGECGILAGLSCDDRPEYEEKLAEVCQLLSDGIVPDQELEDWPSIRFGVEMALADLNASVTKNLYPSLFSTGEQSIPINGLVWMGEKSFMKQQIQDKINEGYSCIKLKIGAIDFEDEMELLEGIRKEFSTSDIELRVDANGAFPVDEALTKLNRLAKLNLHSIEQPIKAGQWELMHDLCQKTPLAIALDEELIGVNNPSEKLDLLDTIQPQYIILKPSLHGGITGSKEWISAAEARKIDWWITSALESNIGLNAIAQFTATLNNPLPQGLGTGQLYSNNIDSPLYIKNGSLHFDPLKKWDLNPLFNS